MGLMHISMKMAIACSSFIYRKSLTLTHTRLVQVTSGHILNLLSTDVSHLEYGLLVVHYIWISPIQVVVGIYLLYRVIGVAAFLGISLHLLYIPLQIYFGKKKSEYRLRAAKRTDERVNIMNEILNGINVIKMYVWEGPFAKRISQARRSEVKIFRASYHLDAITHALEIIMPGFSIYLSVIAFIYLGNTIKASTVYSVIAIFDALRPTLTLMFSEGISDLAKVLVTISRIQTFLNYEGTNSAFTVNRDTTASKPEIILQDVSASWQLHSFNDLVLERIDLKIDHPQLVVIIGSVGSGKSSIFSILLNELPLVSGYGQINGIISYASQTPWLFAASIRQNILFGSSYDEERYKKVIKICALDSDFNSFPCGDRTVIGERGTTLSGGQNARINLARCIYKVADIYLLDDPLSAVDVNVGRKIFRDCIKEFLRDKICVLTTHQVQYLKDADEIMILDGGKLVGKGRYDDLNGLNFDQFLPKLHEDQRHSAALSDFEDYFETKEYSGNLHTFKETMQKGSIKASVYLGYFRYGGNICVIALLVLCFVGSQISESGYYFFISFWVDVEYNSTNGSANVTIYQNGMKRLELIYMYTAIIFTIVALAVTQAIFFYAFFMRASVNLHNSIFEKIIRATMSFFNANPTGVILNRFSDDLGEVDEYIPNILADTIQISLQLVGVIVVTTIINYWFFLPSVGLLLFFLLLRSVYMKTSRSVKRIEGITRSPILCHMSTTLRGITTIRAFGVESVLRQEFHTFQDYHTSAWYLYISSNKAFTFWLDLICGIIASLIILSLFLNNKDYRGGDVGLVINEFLSLMGVLQWGMNQWSELENHMTSVERILEYKKVETEPKRRVLKGISEKWPDRGSITFQNVSMKYNSFDGPIIKNLNVTIKSKEKIGVVGRTGAGKSSTIAALFQLYPIEGSILIDDVDITQVPLERLRSKVAIIPQEPFLFSGSIRYNLDPFEEYNDDVLWGALENVQLKEDAINSAFGLYYDVMESGANLSVGQRQLLCLARAIIRHNKILILDEATANVDPRTDHLIQEIIREKFADCTVITIAHRLQTIMDSDKVIVIDSGAIIEFDYPHLLLQNSGSKFYGMVHATGKSTAENLHRLAKESYCRRIRSSSQYLKVKP
ncbi:probable multidrug resistance-associated protein lethal(2)03659 isoform X2 [Photinus pyralis]|nr:probable multidrug resistance-associated protein lethal(2)03659 isoform X2 [Photinus pyralis]XP_031343815.1 probable multidrug resistance-associated protein lethal(2)03659 isoform X2 [Photinus pyralis]